MELEHPTSSWQAMQDGNVFYKRQQLYSIHEKLPRLEDHVVAGARFGGPIGMFKPNTRNILTHFCSQAMMRDSSKMIALGGSVPTVAKDEIRVYSSSGEGIVLFTVRGAFRMNGLQNLITL